MLINRALTCTVNGGKQTVRLLFLLFFSPANRLALIAITYVLKIVIIFMLSTCFSLCNSARWKVGVSFDLILIF